MSKPSVLAWLKATFAANRRSILLIVSVAALNAVASALYPIAWQKLIDRAVAGTIDYPVVALFIGLSLVQVLPLVFVLRYRFVDRYEFNARFQIFRHVLRLSIPFHKNRESTKVLLEGKKGAEASAGLLELLLQGRTLADIPVAGFALSYIAAHSVPAFAVLAIFIVLFFSLSHWLGRKISRLREEYHERDNDVAAREREILQHIEAVKLHRAEPHEERWFLAHGGKALALNRERTKYMAWFSLMANSANVVPYLVALILFLPALARGDLTIGMFTAMLMYATRAVTPVGSLGDTYQQIKTNAAQLKPALRLLEQKPTVIEAERATEMMPLRHEVRFSDVAFQYPDAAEPILRNLSLTITAGEKVAIVGKTGSGKTTFVRLLVRFYDPDHGIITMDGTDLRQFSFNSLYRQISCVAQEVPIFSGTIGENVRYGITDCSDDQVLAACTNASADFAFRGDGLHTKIGELGEKLSGGERQRLALARVFLRRPSLLILDEATASLDNVTERGVQEAFDRLLQINGGTTMVVIAHRITTVKNANRIIVLDEGRILDQGTHGELLSRCGLYRELCEAMIKHDAE